MDLAMAQAVMEGMADRARLFILQSLREKPRCVEELARLVDLSPSTVSFHVKKLEAAGLVSKERSQYYSMFRLNTEVLSLPLNAFLEFDHAEGMLRQDRERRNRLQVLKAFFTGGRLVRIPVQRMKQRIVLEEMLEAFQAGVRYSEVEVSEILGRFHEDYCALRRLMVDNGLMAREGGVYWVTPPGSADLEDTGGAAEKPASPTSRPAPSRGGKKGTPSRKEKTMDRQKELKRAYKESRIPAGIMQIRHSGSGRIFLVKSMNLPGAFNRHQFQLEMGGHPNKELQSDWQRFGPAQFEFSIVDTLDPPEGETKVSDDDLTELEAQWLAKLQPFGDKGYHAKPKKGS